MTARVRLSSLSLFLDRSKMPDTVVLRDRLSLSQNSTLKTPALGRRWSNSGDPQEDLERKRDEIEKERATGDSVYERTNERHQRSFDVVVVCTGTAHQAAYWQARLERPLKNVRSAYNFESAGDVPDAASRESVCL